MFGGISVVNLEYMIEKQFFNWLSTKENKSQIGELSLAFKKIQEYCVKNRILVKPLIETVNTESIKHVMKVISKTPSSEFTRKEKNMARFVLAYYRSFLSNNEKELEILKKSVKNEKRDSQYGKVDFTKDQGLNINNSKPVEFLYFGEKNNDFTTWQELYCRVVQIMWEDYPHVFDELLYNSDDAKKNPIDFKYITYKWQMENPALIGNFFCVNVPYKVEEIVEKIGKILKICNVDLDKLEIVFEKKGEYDSVETVDKVEKNTDSPDIETDNRPLIEEKSEKKGYKKIYSIDLSKILNPSMGISLDKKRPVSFIYRNVEYTDFGSWSEFYKNISKILWDKYGFFITCSLKNSKNTSGLTFENIFDTKGRSAYALIQKLQSLIDLCSIPHERLILKYADVDADEVIDSEISDTDEADQNEFFEMSLEEITTLDLINPVNFRYFDEIYGDFQTWKAMYIKLFRVLWDDYKHILDEYIGKAPFEDDLRISFVRAVNKNKLTAPEYIGNNVFIETDYSNGALLKNVRTIFKLCKVDFENLVIGCRMKKNKKHEIDSKKKEKKFSDGTGTDEYSKEKKIDFSKIPDIGNTVPTRIKYKDMELGGFSDWPDLYVAICKELYRNYGFLIAEWAGESFSGNTDMGVDLVGANGLGRLKSPKVITDNLMNNLFVETAYSNRQLVRRIRQVLDICYVEYSDVEIYYKEKKVLPKREYSRVRESIEIPQGMIRDDKIALDFVNIPDLNETTPLVINFSGRSNDNFTNWEEMYRETLRILWEKYGFFIKPSLSENFESLTLENVSITEELTPNELVDKIGILLNMYSIKYKDFKIFYRDNKENSMLTGARAEREILEINLSNIGHLAYTIPLKFRYFEKENTSFCDWKGFYVELFKLIWNSHRHALEEYIGKSLLGVIDECPIDITDSEHKNNMISPRCISPDIFIETDYSSYEILKRVRELVKICNIREDKLTIYYERFSVEEFMEIQKIAQRGRKNDDENRRLSFYMWLINEKKIEEKIAKNYMIAIDEAEQYAKSHEIGNGKIYSNGEDDECKNTLEELFTNDDFKRFNEENHHKHMAASRQYLDFIRKNRNEILN